MSIPNKIYIRHYWMPDELDDDWHLNPVDSTKHEIYIRKDALLEWAKEVLASGPIKDSADNGDAWSIGYLCGMRDIIDKLNSWE